MYSTVRPRHEIHVEVSARDVHKDVLEMTAKGEKNWREQLLPNSSLLAYLTFKVPFMYACVFTPFAGPPVPCDVHTARDRHSFSVWHKNRFSRVARAGWWLFTVLFWLCGSRSVVRCREKGVGVCLLCVACSTQWSICHPPECWGGGGGVNGTIAAAVVALTESTVWSAVARPRRTGFVFFSSDWRRRGCSDPGKGNLQGRTHWVGN